MAAALTSDHVNYLIWRYLQEHGYGKAAVQLSRDWQNQDPQALPFADAVRPAYLVQMLQDGLAYDNLLVASRQAENRSAQGPNGADDGVQRPLEPLNKRYSFVDIRKRRASQRSQDGIIESEVEARRKRPRLAETSGTAQRTPGRRKSSKAAGLSVQTQPPPQPVDEGVDHEESAQQVDEIVEEPEQMESTPVRAEPAPPAHTLEIGASTGAQDEEIVDKTLMKTTATHIIPDADIYGLSYQEGDSSSITAIGGSAWHSLTMSLVSGINGQDREQSNDGDAQEATNTSASSSLSIISTPRFPERALGPKPLTYAVPHLSHAASGRARAHALEEIWPNNEQTSVVSLDSVNESLELKRPNGPVTSLRFNPSSTYLLAAWEELDEQSSVLRVWDTSDPDKLTPQVKHVGAVRDAAWLGENSFAACGDAWLQIFRSDPNSPDDSQAWFLPAEDLSTIHGWDCMVFDAASNLLACSSSSDGTVGLLNTESLELRTRSNAHENVITGIQWRPQHTAQSIIAPPRSLTQPLMLPSDIDVVMSEEVTESSTSRATNVRQLASASYDGKVKLWDAASGQLELIVEYTMEPKNWPAFAMAFSPDGRYIAAAGQNMVLLWRVEGDHELVARWPVAVEDGDVTATSPTVEEPQQQTEQLMIDMNSVGHGNAIMADGERSSTSPVPVDIGFTPANQGNDNDIVLTQTDPTTIDYPSLASSIDLEKMHCLLWLEGGRRLLHASGSRLSLLELPVL